MRRLPLLLALIASPALAAELPVQGVLQTLDGEPLDGEETVYFQIVAMPEDESPLWESTRLVDFQSGFFSVYLGEVAPLDDRLLADFPGAWLVIQVGDDEPLTPFRLGSAPYAAGAEFSEEAATLEGASLDDILDQIPQYTGTNGVAVTATDISLDGTWLVQQITDACYDTVDELRAELDLLYLSAGYMPAWSDLDGVPAELLDGDAVRTDQEIIDVGTNHGFALASDLGGTAADLAAATSRLDDVESDIVDHEDWLLATDTLLSDHGIRLAAAEMSIGNQAVEIDLVDGRLMIAEGQIIALQDADAALQALIDQSAADLIAQEASLGALSSRLDATEASMLTAESRLDGLDATVATAGSRLDGLDASMATAGSRLDGLDASVATAGSRLDGLDASILTAESRLDGHDADVASASGRLDAAESSLTSLEGSVSSLQSASGSQGPRLDAVESASTANAAEIAAQTAELQAQAAQLLALAADLQAQTDALAVQAGNHTALRGDFDAHVLDYDAQVSVLNDHMTDPAAHHPVYTDDDARTANDGLYLPLTGGTVGGTVNVTNLNVTGSVDLGGATLEGAQDTSGNAKTVCTGESNSSSWVQYGTDGIYINVSLSGCGFTSTPRIMSSLHGNTSHWTTTGGQNVYSASATTFRIYVKAWTGITPTIANSYGWHIEWVAIGD